MNLADLSLTLATGFWGGNGSGDMVGPSSSVNNHVVFFDGATGKLVKDSGLTLTGSNTGDQNLSGYVQGTVGTSAGNIVALDGSAKLPAVDGSQLTGINAGLAVTDLQYYGLI